MISHTLLKKINVVFKDYPYIASAYLFGSSVTGKATRDSDVDIAILLKDRAPKGRDLLHQEDFLAYEMGKLLGAKEVDLVDLNSKGVIFQHNVLKTGILIYDDDPPFRIKFETNVITHFCDFEPTLRNIERVQLESRIKRYSKS